jgi:hypothetical protein
MGLISFALRTGLLGVAALQAASDKIERELTPRAEKAFKNVFGEANDAHSTAKENGETVAGYWFVQTFRFGEAPGLEQQCESCDAAVKAIKEFRDKNTDSTLDLRVHIPSKATADERNQIISLGVRHL